LSESYHCTPIGSIRNLLARFRLRSVFLGSCLFILLEFTTHSQAFSPPAQEYPRSGGFISPNVTLFAPSIFLAPPGPDRALRSITDFERQIGFYRALLFHPEISPNLQGIIDMMPPRQSTLLRAAEFYSNPAIPWIRKPGGEHEILVDGALSGQEFLFKATTAPSPIEIGQFRGWFTLKPASDSINPANPLTVLGTLGGEFLLNSYGLDRLVDVVAAALRQCYGDLEGPWDNAIGHFNQHDRAAIRRLRHDMPELSALLHRYFVITNVLDEFGGGRTGPEVLFNLKFAIRQSALAQFPHLERFYAKIGPRVRARIVFEDDQAERWTEISFNRGQIKLVFLDSTGLLQPFDADYKPVGNPLALAQVVRGHYRVRVALEYTHHP
jgi:hypothetical protein